MGHVLLSKLFHSRIFIARNISFQQRLKAFSITARLGETQDEHLIVLTRNVRLDFYDFMACLITISTLLFKVYISTQGYPVGVGYDIDDYIYFAAWLAGKWTPNQILPRAYELDFVIPYVCSWSLRLGFGLWLALLFELICNSILSLGAYILLSSILSKRAGLIACILFSFNWFLWWWSSCLLSDEVAATFTMLTFLFMHKGLSSKMKNESKDAESVLYLWLSGMFCAISFLTKYTSLLSIVVLFFYWWIAKMRYKEKFPLNILIHFWSFFAIILGSYSLYYYRVVGKSPLYPIIGYAKCSGVGFAFPRFIRNSLFYLEKTPLTLSLLGTIFLAVGIYEILTKKRTNLGIVLITLWFVIYFLGFSALVRANRDQYMVAWVPATILLSSIGVESFFEKIERKNLSKSLVYLCFIATTLVMIFFTYHADCIPYIQINFVKRRIEFQETLTAHERILEGVANIAYSKESLLAALSLLNSNKLIPIYRFEDFLLIFCFLSPFLLYLYKILQEKGRIKLYLTNIIHNITNTNGP